MKIGTNKNINFNKPNSGGNVDKSVIEKIDEKIKEVTDVIDDMSRVEISETEPTDEDVIIWINPLEDGIAETMLRINDNTIADNTVWSSLKVNEEVQNALIRSSSHVHQNKEDIDLITKKDIDKWNNKSDFSGSYNDLTNKPFIPSISGLATEEYVDEAINDIPEIDLSDYATKSEIPIRMSELENDMLYATEEYIDETIDNAIGDIDFTDYATKEHVLAQIDEAINDNTVANNTTWSSEKIYQQLKELTDKYNDLLEEMTTTPVYLQDKSGDYLQDVNGNYLIFKERI